MYKRSNGTAKQNTKKNFASPLPAFFFRRRKEAKVGGFPVKGNGGGKGETKNHYFVFAKKRGERERESSLEAQKGKNALKKRRENDFCFQEAGYWNADSIPMLPCTYYGNFQRSCMIQLPASSKYETTESEITLRHELHFMGNFWYEKYLYICERLRCL